MKPGRKNDPLVPDLVCDDCAQLVFFGLLMSFAVFLVLGLGHVISEFVVLTGGKARGVEQEMPFNGSSKPGDIMPKRAS